MFDFSMGYCVMATHNSNILDRVVFRIFQCNLCGTKLDKPSGVNRMDCPGCKARLLGVKPDG